jgi:hypothetical protein
LNSSSYFMMKCISNYQIVLFFCLKKNVFSLWMYRLKNHIYIIFHLITACVLKCFCIMISLFINVAFFICHPTVHAFSTPPTASITLLYNNNRSIVKKEILVTFSSIIDVKKSALYVYTLFYIKSDYDLSWIFRCMCVVIC